MRSKKCKRILKCNTWVKDLHVSHVTSAKENLVFTTTGGMGKECTQFNKRLAEMISEKTKEKYSKVMCHIRTRLRFALLRATLVAVRGYRGKRNQMSAEKDEDEIDFNLIPEEIAYETY